MDVRRVNKLTTCMQCSYLFAIKNPLRPRGYRCPVILPCGHSVCEGCVKLSVQNSGAVVCTVCQTKTTVVSPDQLPINMYLLGCFVNNHYEKTGAELKIGFQPAAITLQSKKGKQYEPGNEMCSVCNVTQAVWNCLDCKTVFCSQCSIKVHKPVKNLQKHRKVQLGSEVCVPPIAQPNCKVHDEQKLIYHCKDCDVVTCARCALESHRSHAIWTIQERNESVLPEVKEAFTKANLVLKRLQKTQKDVKNLTSKSGPVRKAQADDPIVQARQTISNHFVHLFGTLQLLQTSLLEQIERANLGTMPSLDLIAQELETNVNNVKCLLDEAVIACDPSNLPLSDVHNILEKLLKTEQLPCHLITEEATKDAQAKFTVDPSFIEQLKTHCHLQVPDVGKIFLARTDELPEDYIMETIDENLSDLSSVSRSSSLSTLSESNLSDSTSGTSQPQGLLSAQPVKGSTEMVTVTHIKDPSSFYVMRESDKKTLDNLTKELSAYVAMGHKPPVTVLKDSLYVVQFGVDHNWYRARVKRVIPSTSESDVDKIEVFYIDYGNTEFVTANRLRCIHVKHAITPPLAQHCSLFGLAPVHAKWPHEAIKTMAEILDGRRVLMTVMDYNVGVYVVDLSRCPADDESDVPLSVRDALVFLELGCFLDSAMPASQKNAVHKQYLGPEMLEKGQIYDVTVGHIVNPSKVYVQKFGSHAQYLTTIMNDMNVTYSASANRGLIYTPSVGMPCAAQYSLDKKWYRAKVLGLPGNKKVEVLYVDYGNREVVSWTCLRRLYDRFLRLPPQAIACTLTDIIPIAGGQWSDQATQYLYKIAFKKVLKLFVDETKRLQTSVTLYESLTTVDLCLNAMLVKSGHAKSTGSRSILVEYHKTGDRVLTGSNPKKENIAPSSVPKTKHSVKKQTKVAKGKKVTNSSVAPQQVAVAVAPQQVAVEPEPKLTPEGHFRLEVTVLSVVDPSCIYVSVASQENDIENLMSELQAYYKSSKLPDVGKQWNENDKCCVYDTKEKMWYRGIIVEVKDSMAKVFLKDFARLETVPLTFLRPLEERFMEVRDGAVKCHLAGIKAAGDKAEWSTLACEQLVELVGQYDRHYISKKGNIENYSLPVELWVKQITVGGPLEPTIEEWITLNKKLVDQGLAIPVRCDADGQSVPSHQVLKELKEQNQNIEIVLIPEIIQSGQGSIKPIEPYSSEGSDDDQQSENGAETEQVSTEWLPAVPITMKRFSSIPTYVDDDCSIYLHQIECEEIIKVIQKTLQSRLHGSQPKPNDLYWFPGQICSAQYRDKNWYRGRVLEVMDDHTVKVLFVDYGNIEELKALQMRKKVFMTHIPVQCHKYKLDGVVPISDDGVWPRNVLDVVHATIVEKKCKITVKSDAEEGNLPLISVSDPDSTDLAALLVNMKYARYIDNVLQVKAALEPAMYKVKVISEKTLSDEDSDHADSDNASVIIEEEIIEDVDVEVNEVLEGVIPEECLDEGKEQEGDVQSETEMVLNEIETPAEVNSIPTTNVVTEVNDVQVNAEEEEEDIAKISFKEEDEILDCIEEVVLQAQIEELALLDDEGTSIEIEIEEEAATKTERKEDIVLHSYEQEIIAVDDVEQEKLTDENQTKKTDLLLIEQEEQPKLWSDCISEDGSEQDALFAYKILDFLKCDEVLVEVTAIISPTEVVIRPTECEENAELIKDFLVLSRKMQQEAPFQPIISSPFVGQPCCACFKEDGQWYRATVISIHPNNSQLKIQYVDYGNVETVDLNTIHELQPEWTKVPLQGLQCHLWKLKAPETFNPLELLDQLTSCLFQPPLRAKIKDRGSPRLCVELFAGDSSVPVYQHLVDNGLLLVEEDE